MVTVATEWFGFRPDDQLKVHVDDGLKFIQQEAKKGVLVLNLVSRDSTLKAEVIQRLKDIFPAIFVSHVEEEVNEIVFAIKDTNSAAVNQMETKDVKKDGTKEKDDKAGSGENMVNSGKTEEANEDRNKRLETLKNKVIEQCKMLDRIFSSIPKDLCVKEKLKMYKPNLDDICFVFTYLNRVCRKIAIEVCRGRHEYVCLQSKGDMNMSSFSKRGDNYMSAFILRGDINMPAFIPRGDINMSTFIPRGDNNMSAFSPRGD
ncbi:EFNMT-like protein [Mya arenaria]|uniref:EFNMT-like protein n=1 Tax=Mya arenaria TaxID=6604 RepID=A0ABY7GHY4_MYAAR|nr:EFNMT-like protein [Mya arenaria]